MDSLLVTTIVGSFVSGTIAILFWISKRHFEKIIDDLTKVTHKQDIIGETTIKTEIRIDQLMKDLARIEGALGNMKADVQTHTKELIETQIRLQTVVRMMDMPSKRSSSSDTKRKIEI